MMLANVFLAWIPFLHPIAMPTSARLWMFFPLAAAVAVVYRATRAVRATDLPKATVKTFVNICLGMWLIAIGAYAIHMFVIRIWHG